MSLRRFVPAACMLSVVVASSARSTPAHADAAEQCIAAAERSQPLRSDGKLRMMYVLKPTVPVPKQVNFYEDYADTMRRDAKANFPAAMMRALITSNK